MKYNIKRLISFKKRLQTEKSTQKSAKFVVDTIYDLFIKDKSIAEKPFPSVIHSSYNDYQLPIEFGKQVFYLSPYTGSNFFRIGGGTTSSTGTVSTDYTKTEGLCVTFATADTVDAAAGVEQDTKMWFIGDGENVERNFSGFFFHTRIAFHNNSYDGAATGEGSRFFTGLSSVDGSVLVESDKPEGDIIGLQRIFDGDSDGKKDGTFKIYSSTGTEQQTINTGMAFEPEHTYDFSMYCRPGGDVHWYLKNIDTDNIQEGTAYGVMPDSGELLKAVIHIQTLDAIVRSIKMQSLYVCCEKK